MDDQHDSPDESLPMPPLPICEITAVHYQRLVSLGNYENERVGAWAQVKEGQSPEAALSGLRTWVQAQVSQYEEKQALEADINRLRGEKLHADHALLKAKERYEQARSFIEGMGLKMPGRWASDDEIPW
jgi:hypothetical protein